MHVIQLFCQFSFLLFISCDLIAISPLSFPSSHWTNQTFIFSKLNYQLFFEKKRSIKFTTMSWQTYVDDHLMCPIEETTNHLKAAAIIGFDGSVWAQSTTFPQVISLSSRPFVLIIWSLDGVLLVIHVILFSRLFFFVGKFDRKLSLLQLSKYYVWDIVRLLSLYIFK